MNASPRLPFRSFAPVAALVTVALAASVLLITAAPSHAPAAPNSPGATASALGSGAPAPASAASTDDAGTVIDHASVEMYGFSWSPDGSRIAAIVLNGFTDADGRIDVVTPSGQRVRTLVGRAAAWVDPAHLAVLAPLDGAHPDSPAAVVDVSSGASTPIPGRWASVTANGRGTAALEPATPDRAPAPPSFSLWTAASGLRSVQGSPDSWSPDGSLLAVWLPAPAAASSAGTGVILAATGSPVPGTVAVVDAASGRTVASYPDTVLDTRSGAAWSPDGSWILGAPAFTDGTGPAALPVPSAGRSVGHLDSAAGIYGLGWTSDGRVVTVTRNVLATWDPGTGTRDALPAGSRAVVAGNTTYVVEAGGRPLAAVFDAGGPTIVGVRPGAAHGAWMGWIADDGGVAGRDLLVARVASLPPGQMPRVAGSAPEPLAGCRPLDASAVRGGFAVMLSAGSDEASGQIDGSTLGAAVTNGQPWRQPGPSFGLSVPAATALSVALRDADDPGVTYCIETAEAYAARFSPVGAAPEMPHPLATAETPAPALPLGALPAAGDWVIRVTVSAQTSDATVAEETAYFRVRAGLPPEPEPTPVPSPAVPCGEPGPSAPVIDLVANGAPHRAEIGTSAWRGTGAEVGSEPLPEQVVALPADGSGATIAIGDDVCALAWSVTYAAIPPDATTGRVLYDPLGSLALQRNPASDPAFARANRIALGALPPGEWVITADLQFADGQQTAYWRIRVPMPAEAQTRAAANATAERFLRSVYVTGDAAAAWLLLGPASRAAWSSEAAWAAAERAHVAAAGGTFAIQPQAFPGADAVKAVFWSLTDDVRATADVRQAWVFGIEHPRAADLSASWEQLLVAPLVDGTGWRVWEVR